MGLMVIAKIIFLFIGVWWTSVNVTKVFYKDKIPSNNFVLMTIGIVGFIVLQFELYK